MSIVPVAIVDTFDISAVECSRNIYLKKVDRATAILPMFVQQVTENSFLAKTS